MDDDPAFKKAFEGFVFSQGLDYDYQWAETLAEAHGVLERAPANGRPVDAVVCDYELEDGHALELLGDEIPLIITTVSGDRETAVSAMRAGAADYLVKDDAFGFLKVLPLRLDKAVKACREERRNHLLSHALTSINDSVFVTDMDETVLFVNSAFTCTFGYREEDILGAKAGGLWPEFAGDLEEIGAMSQTNEGWRGETLMRKKSGASFPVYLTRSVVHDDKMRHVAITSVARDISERIKREEELKHSVEEKEVLIREVHHRVKNNLQVISSLLNLQGGQVIDPATAEALRDSQNRVKALALIHERLHQSDKLTELNLADYLDNLVSHVKSSFRDLGDVDMDLDVEPVGLDVDRAVTCGLVFNELISNALKHAFAEGRRRGNRQVRVSARRDAAAGQLVLMVADNGRGLAPDMDLDNPSSLGLQLVKMLTLQLKGRMTVTSDAGASITLRIPL